MLLAIIKEPFELLILAFANTVKFMRSLYTKDLKLSEENSFNKLTDLRDLNKCCFDMFRKKLILYKNTLVDIKKLIKDLREEFNVSEHLRRIIYFAYEENDTKAYLKEKMNGSNENISQEFKLRNEKVRKFLN